MHILIVTVTRGRSGQPMRVQRSVDADRLEIGRGAQNALHLPDPRVPLAHSVIAPSGGQLWLKLLGPRASGAPERILLVPTVQIEVGGYRLTVEATTDHDLALAVEFVRPLPDNLDAIKSRAVLSLAGTWVSKRWIAWALALPIAALFLAWPVLNATRHDVQQAAAAAPIPPDLAWSPGPLMAAHAQLGEQCNACHQKPFVQVGDAACGECHSKVASHVQGAGATAVFGQTRCVACHSEHKGGTIHEAVAANRDCVGCHASIAARLPSTQLANSSDFAKEHPQFRLALWRGPVEPSTAMVAQDNKAQLVEHSGLKFPHDVHLKAGLRGPQGRETLDCTSCHRGEPSGRGFVQITMAKDCQRCHSLEFEPALSARQAPHGSVEAMMIALAEFYASAALNNLDVDRIADRGRALGWAQRKAASVARDLVETRTCVICHEVKRVASTTVPWTIEPVHIADRWMPNGRFDHAKHQGSECADCHAAHRSAHAGDVLIPDLASCRECHAGATPESKKLVSQCSLCHDFHHQGFPPMVKGSMKEARAGFVARRE